MATEIPDVTPTAPAPVRGDGEELYSDSADAWAASIVVTNDSWNASIAAINILAAELEASEIAAAASATAAAISESNAAVSESIASGSANYKGNYSDQAGAANKPYSVGHIGSVWNLNNNLADVTTSVPADDNVDWQEAGVSEEAAISLSLLY